MPELTHDCGGDTTTSYGPVSSTGFWSKHRDDVSYNQLQKFWSELPLHARRELLRIDKQTLFEQARKNMYCSRCNGLLLEGFMQIIMYGKSLQHEGNRLVTSKSQTVENVCMKIEGSNNGDVIQDPSVHPWGGLATTRDGTLTLLDCYICSKYLKGLQNVFDSARARERERELLYPDACGGGGRGWISQGMVGYGRGHGTRETCALHTARLSVDTLVDFWSALGEETRFSLLRMKEEDFMERLMYRFDSKRFCRDCRKNVIREFKELKELKRMRKETSCTSWFCVADTSFPCEVTLDTVQAVWPQKYANSKGIYDHYEWAVGTGAGKSDKRKFENVGLNSRVKASGLKLDDVNSCYITLHAYITDKSYDEVSVKAHALKGQHCVHGSLVVGDGFVTINRGDNIRRFFEHAEEAEEEEDDESMDKDGNELDGECSRPQKHAKSPELAREFLLDAATVIFKEQVEKAFREGTARQNAHSMFVSLALKLLEKRVIVACKDIITLEKQFKLLEEEEKEKRDEEERKERRRVKEKEKKLRRKERLRIKEQEKDKKCGQASETAVLDRGKEELTSVNNEPVINDNTCYEEQEQEQEQEQEHEQKEQEDTEDTLSFMPTSDDYNAREDQMFDYDEKLKDGNQLFANGDQLKHNRRRPKSWKDYQHDQPSKWSDRRRFDYGSTVTKPGPRYHSDGFETSRNGNLNGLNKPVTTRSNGSRYNDRSHCCQHTYYRPKLGTPEPDTDTSKPYTRRNKFNNNNNQAESVRERPKTKMISGNTKKVWEPRSNLDSADVIDTSADVIKLVNSPNGPDLDVTIVKDNNLKESESNVHIEPEPEPESGTTDLSTSTDSCSSSLSEGDGNTSFSSNPQNAELSSTSDSEYANHLADMVKENASELLSETAESVAENNNCNIIPPPLQAQSVHFPVFQPPSMGYYHQGPVPWTTGPPNGLVPLGPLPHPNHYMFASPSPFGYGNSRYVQYGVGGLHPPPLNHGQLPMYQAVPPVNMAIPVKGGYVNSEKAQNGHNENENSDKTQKGNAGFSLFHFGGPVDVSNGFNPDVGCVKEEVDVNADSCGVVKDVEEYNLFAASNGIQFSIF